MANTTIPSELIAADAITGAKIADNAVDSEHYTDGSIDTAHIADSQVTVGKMAANSVDSDQYVDGSIDTAHIADDQVTLAKMAGLARGKIIVGDSSGNPAALAIGTNGYVLKSDGTDIAWAADADTAALTTEQVQDIAGAMFSSNTETGITATYQDADGTIDLVVGTLNQNTTGSAATLTTARTIGGTSFDGSANIAVGLAATATTLATARTIGGVSFDGSANINLPGVNSAGNQNVDAALVDGENFKINGGQGSDGQLMTSTGSGVAWEDAPAGGPTFKTFGTGSIMIGDNATGTIDAADNNTGLGVDVFAALTSGDGNTAVGAIALDAITTSADNTAVGHQALTNATSGAGNTALGKGTMTGVVTGSNNTAVGRYALSANTSASNNVAVGINALVANTTGAGNTASGFDAMVANVDGSNNAAFGRQALADNTSGNENTAVGYTALGDNTTASYNTGVGRQAGRLTTTGSENVFMGYSAGRGNTTGATNTVIGFRAGYGRTTGGQNVIIGSDASYSAGTGSKNVAIGVNAGYNWTTAYNNTVIGYNARTDEYNSYGAITIGYNGTGYSSEAVTFVNGSSKTYVGIGSTNWGGTSDQRLKENVQASTAGLSFINDLRPVTFDWKKKKDIDNSLEGYENSDDRYNAYNPINRHGFVAQEVKTALDNHSEVLSGSEIWSESKDGTQGISETALIPMLVKALQEADDKIDALTARIETLEG